MIIAIDFDGTIVKHQYPEIGEPIFGAIDTIKALQRNGHDIFLWTMRGNNKMYNRRDLLFDAVNYLRDNGIELCGVNNSPAQFSTSKKQYAHIYIDDAALGCPVIKNPNERPYANWEEIAKLLKDKKLITEGQYNDIFQKH